MNASSLITFSLQTIQPSLQAAATNMAGIEFCALTEQVRDRFIAGEYGTLALLLAGRGIKPSGEVVQQVLCGRSLFFDEELPRNLFQAFPMPHPGGIYQDNEVLSQFFADPKFESSPEPIVPPAERNLICYVGHEEFSQNADAELAQLVRAKYKQQITPELERALDECRKNHDPLRLRETRRDLERKERILTPFLHSILHFIDREEDAASPATRAAIQDLATFLETQYPQRRAEFAAALERGAEVSELEAKYEDLFATTGGFYGLKRLLSELRPGSQAWLFAILAGLEISR